MAGEKQIRFEAIHEHADPLAHAEAALRELHASWDCAQAVGSEPWEFAVKIGSLTALGLGESGLRWLTTRGFVQHAREVTCPADTSRHFEPELSLVFSSETCFVLGDAGHDWLTAGHPAHVVMRLHDEPAVAALVPRWDKTTRTLYLGDRIVKRYRQPAGNQAVVLSAFEEEGWAHIIDDPIPPVNSEPPCAMRLRDTIRRLNSNQINPLVRFYGDGSGSRVGWEAVEVVTLPLEAARRKARRAA